MNTKLRSIRRALAKGKPAAPREVHLTLKPGQLAALQELRRSIVELENRANAVLLGIVTGHGITAFRDATINGVRLTVTDLTGEGRRA